MIKAVLFDFDLTLVDSAIIMECALDELEKRWIQSLQDKVTWIGYVAANIYTILLFAAALLTICGFLRIIIKRRLRASRVDDDDEVVTD